jgi:hypothetical protein
MAQMDRFNYLISQGEIGTGEGIRTLELNLGKVVLDLSGTFHSTP